MYTHQHPEPTAPDFDQELAEGVFDGVLTTPVEDEPDIPEKFRFALAMSDLDPSEPYGTFDITQA